MPHASPPLLARTRNTTLVCIIGSLRSNEAAWRSLGANLLAPLSADLALLVGYGVAILPTLLQLATHVWRIPEYTEWDELVRKLLGGEAWKRGLELLPNLWGGLRDRNQSDYLVPGSGAIIFMLRLVLLAQLDAMVDPPYTQLVLTRSDHYYACPHPPVHTLPDEVYTPDGEGWGGVTDRHTVFAFSSRRKVLPVMPWLVSCGRRREPLPVPLRGAWSHLWHGLPECTEAGQRAWNPEKALYAFFSANSLRLRHFNRSMFVVADRDDASRWSTGHAIVHINEQKALGATHLRCKYPTEYERAARYCKLRQLTCWSPTDANYTSSKPSPTKAPRSAPPQG